MKAPAKASWPRTSVFVVGTLPVDRMRADVEAFTGAKRVSFVGGTVNSVREANVVCATLDGDTLLARLPGLVFQAQLRGMLLMFGREVALATASEWVGDPEEGLMGAYRRASGAEGRNRIELGR